MADICYEVVTDASAYESRPLHSGRRQRFPMDKTVVMQEEWEKKNFKRNKLEALTVRNENVSGESPVTEASPRYGVSLVCGRRREMEDAVAIHPSFSSHSEYPQHYFGVYDGHGCSHVAARCRERLHKLVQEELHSDREEEEHEWRKTMERSFTRMDKEVVLLSESVVSANCKCELQTPDCDAVGSTAVVSIITPDKIVVANCGDSRAVLCRNGKPFPLSTDHKPDRPDELDRIEGAGGRVIYWDCPRVLGVLAMSRAIGDNYLKPYVTCEPEVTVTDRTDDDCLILASDGLWDVVSNETACSVARMCLSGGRKRRRTPEQAVETISDKACMEASVLLTKLALARHSSDNVSVVVIDLRRKGHVTGH
ncbi:PREDICTED: probable protein phosphatase 2C 24 [Brassica oleracea var. oleracea]|uniref:protein-serine/threonine phosphatase n=1 Tax=Brassica oleracea var. oleracea TaxID=109376 RepID=A0A0D3BTV7_BRAOL|nr:PREDICTED: probable protein phosphatase 2C 24 [Brassica oleracea var. oleracea]